MFSFTASGQLDVLLHPLPVLGKASVLGDWNPLRSSEDWSFDDSTTVQTMLEILCNYLGPIDLRRPSCRPIDRVDTKIVNFSHSSENICTL